MNASSLCHNSSLGSDRSPPLQMSVLICAWPSSTWRIRLLLPRPSSPRRPSGHLLPLRPLCLCPCALNKLLEGSSLATAAADAVAGAAKVVSTVAQPVASKVDLQAASHGLPSSTHGPGPSTCGPAPPLEILTANFLAPSCLHRHSKPLWPACPQPTSTHLQPLGHTTRRPHGCHGLPSPSATPSAPSPSPHHRPLRTG